MSNEVIIYGCAGCMRQQGVQFGEPRSKLRHLSNLEAAGPQVLFQYPGFWALCGYEGPKMPFVLLKEVLRTER